VGGEKWRAGLQASSAKAGRGRIGQLAGDLALPGSFQPSKAPRPVESAPVRAACRKRTSALSFNASGGPEPGATEWATGGARQSVESASAPLRARWLVGFRPVRRRLNRRQIEAKASVPCRSQLRPSRARNKRRASKRRSPRVESSFAWCAPAHWIGCRSRQAVPGPGSRSRSWLRAGERT